MKKKSIFVMSALTISLLLAACNNNANETANNDIVESSIIEETSTIEESTVEESTVEENSTTEESTVEETTTQEETTSIEEQTSTEETKTEQEKVDEQQAQAKADEEKPQQQEQQQKPPAQETTPEISVSVNPQPSTDIPAGTTPDGAGGYYCIDPLTGESVHVTPNDPSKNNLGIDYDSITTDDPSLAGGNFGN